MTKQIKHKRVSKKGKPFLAGSRKLALPAPVKMKPLFLIQQPMVIRRLIDSIKKLYGNAELEIKSNHLYFMRMDPTNVSMVIMQIKDGRALKIDKGAVGEKLGLNFEMLAGKLKNFKKGEIEVYRLGDDIHLVQGDKKFNIEIIKLEDKGQKIPDLKFATEGKLDPKLLQEAVKNASSVGESIVLTSKPGKLLWSVNQEEKDLPQGSGSINSDMTGQHDIKSKYSLQYLKKLVSDATLYEKALLQMGTDWPLQVTLDGPVARKTFILAPRVEDDYAPKCVVCGEPSTGLYGGRQLCKKHRAEEETKTFKDAVKKSEANDEAKA